jgi:hypothetical protein
MDGRAHARRHSAAAVLTDTSSAHATGILGSLRQHRNLHRAAGDMPRHSVARCCASGWRN